MADVPSRRSRVPFTVLGGYLGAGKTTVLAELLRRAAGRRIAVVVNDFGEIAIDASLIERWSHDGGVEQVELTNGCICCSLSGAFPEAMDHLRALAPPPDHVVVEVSGVGQPAAVANWGRGPGFVLDGVVVVVDATDVRRLAADRFVGDTVLRQVGSADLLVLSKVDLAPPATIVEVRTWLAELAPTTPVVEVVRGDVPVELLLGVGNDRERSVPVGPLASEPLVTTSRTWPNPVEAEALRSALATMPPQVLRAKGIVQGADGGLGRRLVVHVVGSRLDMIDDGPWVDGECSRLVAIATREVDVRAVERWLDRCAWA